MPEGDTIFRAARTLHRALGGKRVTRFETAVAALGHVAAGALIVGRTVERVSAAGKHLLMRLSAVPAASAPAAGSPPPARRGPLTLHTHLRMNGSWHIYRPGERWRRPAGAARVIVGVEDFVAVGFALPVAELLDDRALARHPILSTLGPDLLGGEFDADEAMRRARARPDALVADAVLDQRVAAGAGNIFKSEVLFLCGIHPSTPVGALAEEDLRAVVRTARRLLTFNVAPASGAGIVTYTGWAPAAHRDRGARLFVYGRAGRPCRRCGTEILGQPTGARARLTYWCPRCQPGAFDRQ